jgi:putative Holliday junction resolvase
MTRILGLDVGDKTLGVAVSDELGWTAQGVTVHLRTSLTADLRFLRATCAQYEVAAIVVGLPKNMDGSLGSQAQKTLTFIEHVRREVALPVIAWDERLTTQAAERALLEANTSRRRRKAVRDQLAAQLILQSYLEWRARHPAAATALPPAERPSLGTGLSPEHDTAETEGDEMGKPDAKEQR